MPKRFHWSRLRYVLPLLFVLPLFPGLLGSCRSGKVESALGIQLKLEIEKLSNGMTIILVENRSVPVISYQTWFRSGSVDEKPGMTGTAHFFEHLMFKGTEKYPARQYFEQLEAKGAQVNAYTTRDYTVYYQNFIPELLERVVDMESDRMRNLILTDEVIEVERRVVMEERRLRVDNDPGGKMQEALWQLAFRRHGYQWPVIGRPEDVAMVSPDTLRQFYNEHYQPGNAVLVLVGDFSKESAMKLIRAAYEKIPKGNRPTRVVNAEPEQKEERRLILRDEIVGERLAEGYPATAASDDDSYSLDVLANILFAGSASRAHRRLVEDKDIALGVSGSAYTPTFPGLFMISVALREGVPAAQAEAELAALIREVQEKGVTKEEIEIAVRQLTVELVDSVRTQHGLGQLIGTVMMVLGDPERFARDLEKYQKVTQADVKRVAETYLTPNRRSVVTLLPLAREGSGK